MTDTPWLTAAESGAIARVSEKVIRRAVRSGRLKAAVVDRRGTLRIHRSWLHTWLEQLATAGEELESTAERQRLAAGDREPQPEPLRIAR